MKWTFCSEGINEGGTRCFEIGIITVVVKVGFCGCCFAVMIG